MNVPAVQLVVLALLLLAVAAVVLRLRGRVRPGVPVPGERTASPRGAVGRGLWPSVVADPGPVLSVTTFLRIVAEAGAVVAVTLAYVGSLPIWWHAALASAGTMAALSFVVVGVGPRTLGRQHADVGRARRGAGRLGVDAGSGAVGAVTRVRR